MNTKRILDPANSELVFNLWAIADIDTGFVYALGGRAYRLDGGDDEKLEILRRLSFTDFQLANRYAVPKRFSISTNDGTLDGVTTISTVNDPNAELFEVVFQELESNIPPLLIPRPGDDKLADRKQMVPQDPLTVRTILFEDEFGRISTFLSAEPGPDYMSEPTDELYLLNDRDRSILGSTIILLMKIVRWSLIDPKQVETVAEVIELLDRFPSVGAEADITVQLSGPRRWYGEHEIWHWWEVNIEERVIHVSSGGHFYRKSTGGDTFTCMNWSIEPGRKADLNEYWESHLIVDDVMAFEPEVAQIDLSELKYSLTVMINGEKIDVENVEDEL